MKYPIARDGVFWTLQGEGALQGTPMAFVRLAGCSVGCAHCDTDYGVFRRLTAEELVAEIRSVVPAGFTWPWVWLTGGEPTDHDLRPLIDLLKTVGFRVAVATAGVRQLAVEGLPDWISVSPHSLTAVQRFGHELKVVPGLNGLTWSAVETIDREWHSFPWRFIQPMEYRTVNGPEKDGAATRQALQECVEFVQTHPGWRLTIQAHKTWGLK
jgi:7-carboxy-7-deazaguanine synthase